MMQDTSLATPKADSVCNKETLTEAALASLAACICRLLAFLDLQDFFLAISPIRSFVTSALAGRCQTALQSRLLSPAKNQTSFESLNYHLDPKQKQLLLHAAIHALIWQPGMSGVYGGEIAPVGRILLQTGDQSIKMQCAVAAALANQLQASYLVVDDELLNIVARSALGSTVLEATEVGGTGLLRFFLSCFLSGGRLAFVWDLVRRACLHMDPPVVLFIPDVEQTICGSFLRYDAFVDSFGTLEKPPASAARPRAALQQTFTAPILLVGGCALGDAGADLVASSQGKQKGSSTSPGPRQSPGAGGPVPGTDDFPAASLIPQDLINLPDEWPNPRRKLPKLFATRIKLKVPSSGPAADRHSQQLLQDSSDLMAEKNFALLQAILPNRRLPAPCSLLYRKQDLTRTQWMLVASWASSMERILAAKAAGTRAQSGPEGPDVLMLENGNADGASMSSAASTDADAGGPPSAASASGAGPPSPRAGTGGAPLSLPPGPTGSQLDAIQSGGVLAALSPAISALSSAILRVPWVGREALGLLPAYPGAAVAAAAAAALTPSGAPGMMALVPASTAAPRTPTASAQPSGDTDDLREALGEEALWYGLRMLERTSGTLKGHIKTSNVYEKKLLDEVIRPDAAGGGFDEVGALQKQKDVLRETVQLPLQRPDLFMRGSLARPCKGVLLFGPPGTGKTMLARAAAAECGASFLAIQPSTLTSKWLGDGVRNVRAVFTLAAKLAPCVLFVDEVDALLSKRNSTQEHEALRELKCEFMQLWDGIRVGGSRPDERVMVLGATNRPQDLDEAALRRFSRRIMVDLPDKAARKAILEVMVENEKLADDVDLDKVAAGCEGFSGSDLRQLCTEAAMRPLRDLLAAAGKSAKGSEEKKGKKRKAGVSDLEEAARTAGPPVSTIPSARLSEEPSSGAAPSTLANCSADRATTAGQEPSRAAQPRLPTAGTGGGPHPPGCGASSGALGDSMPDNGQTSALAAVAQDVGRGPAATDSGHVTEGEARQGVENPSPAQAAFAQLLLAECDSMEQTAGQEVPTELRAITAKDFEAAQKEVSASLSSDSIVLNELKLWNEQYGEGSKSRNTFNPKLTYFN